MSVLEKPTNERNTVSFTASTGDVWMIYEYRKFFNDLATGILRTELVRSNNVIVRVTITNVTGGKCEMKLQTPNKDSRFLDIVSDFNVFRSVLSEAIGDEDHELEGIVVINVDIEWKEPIVSQNIKITFDIDEEPESEKDKDEEDSGLCEMSSITVDRLDPDGILGSMSDYDKRAILSEMLKNPEESADQTENNNKEKENGRR